MIILIYSHSFEENKKSALDALDAKLCLKPPLSLLLDLHIITVFGFKNTEVLEVPVFHVC